MCGISDLSLKYTIPIIDSQCLEMEWYIGLVALLTLVDPYCMTLLFAASEGQPKVADEWAGAAGVEADSEVDYER